MPTFRIRSNIIFTGTVLGLMVCCWTYVCGATEANVPAKTTLSVGQRTTIAVTGTLDFGGTIRASIRYSPSVMRILSAHGSPGYAFQCLDVSIVENRVESPTSAVCVVECSYCISIEDDTLFTLAVEGVVGPDSSGALGIERLEANGVDVQGAVFNTGVVERRGGSTTSQTVIEGVTGNYPNPFSSRTRFVFVLQSPGIVRFLVRNTQGRIVIQLDPIIGVAGENVFDFEWDAWRYSSGVYVLQMDTDRGTYYHGMTVMR